MKIVFAGSSREAIPVLEYLALRVEIAGVLTKPAERSGRGGGVHDNVVKDAAHSLGINKIWDDLDDAAIKEMVKLADLGVVVSYGKILPEPVLQTLQFGWINLHYSLLPKYRGPSPVQTAILNGETQTGVTVFQLDQGMDTGPVWDSQSFEILPLASASQVLESLSRIGGPKLTEVIDRIENGVDHPKEQVGEPTFTRKITKADAKIRIEESVSQVLNRIRAFTIVPGAYLVLENGEKLIVSLADRSSTSSVASTVKSTAAISQLSSETSSAVSSESSSESGSAAGSEEKPGKFWIDKTRVLLRVSDGWIELIQVKPQSKRFMAARDWVRGLPELPRLA
jgi:methionyl-tRNA formyltransferase